MITVIFTILSALYDNGKRFQDHTGRALFRFIILLLISIYEMPMIIVGIWQPTLIKLLTNIFIFYILFDYILNLLEGRKWNYVGNTAMIDKLWNTLGGLIPQLIFKIILLFLTFKLNTL